MTRTAGSATLLRRPCIHFRRALVLRDVLVDLRAVVVLFTRAPVGDLVEPDGRMRAPLAREERESSGAIRDERLEERQHGVEREQGFCPVEEVHLSHNNLTDAGVEYILDVIVRLNRYPYQRGLKNVRALRLSNVGLMDMFFVFFILGDSFIAKCRSEEILRRPTCTSCAGRRHSYV